MQKIAIESVETKTGKTGKTFYKITDIKGGEFTSFDTALAILKKGDVIDAEIEVSGKYTNIKSFTVLQHIEIPPSEHHLEKVAEGFYSPPAPSDQTYKNRSTAISYSKDLCVAGKIELKDITVYANKFLLFIEANKI